jgi:hypothetical protein
MNFRNWRLALVMPVMAGLSLVPSILSAQTPEEDARRQEQYRQAEERNREVQQRWEQQQRQAEEQRQQSARRLDEDRQQAAAPPPASAGYSGGSSGGSSGGQTDMAELRERLKKQKPLPAANNPLLGTWKRQAAPAGKKDDVMEMLRNFDAQVTGQVCDMALIADQIEFRESGMRGHDRVLGDADFGRVEYRGNAASVAVLAEPPFLVPLLIFEMKDADHAEVAGFGCRGARRSFRRARACQHAAGNACNNPCGGRTGQARGRLRYPAREARHRHVFCGEQEHRGARRNAVGRRQ